MPDIRALLRGYREKLLQPYSDTKREQVGLALNHLDEALQKLNMRLDEVIYAERLLANKENSPASLEDLQLKFVDKVEQFHRQMYSALSVLILVLNQTGIHGEKPNHPINSVDRFLDYLLGKNESLSISIDYLKKSISFRAKFVDHPQQHKLHDWMTYLSDGRYYIIYFIPTADRNVYLRVGNPLDVEFEPPVSCSDFYVSPHFAETYGSLCNLIVYCLSLVDFDWSELEESK